MYKVKTTYKANENDSATVECEIQQIPLPPFGEFLLSDTVNKKYIGYLCDLILFKANGEFLMYLYNQSTRHKKKHIPTYNPVLNDIILAAGIHNEPIEITVNILDENKSPISQEKTFIAKLPETNAVSQMFVLNKHVYFIVRNIATEALEFNLTSCCSIQHFYKTHNFNQDFFNLE